MCVERSINIFKVGGSNKKLLQLCDGTTFNFGIQVWQFELIDYKQTNNNTTWEVLILSKNGFFSKQSLSTHPANQLVSCKRREKRQLSLLLNSYLSFDCSQDVLCGSWQSMVGERGWRWVWEGGSVAQQTLHTITCLQLESGGGKSTCSCSATAVYTLYNVVEPIEQLFTCTALLMPTA